MEQWKRRGREGGDRESPAFTSYVENICIIWGLGSRELEYKVCVWELWVQTLGRTRSPEHPNPRTIRYSSRKKGTLHFMLSALCKY